LTTTITATQRAGLIETLLLQGRNPIFLDQMSRIGADAVGHATAVAHLSLLLGIKLENYLIQERKRLPCNRAKEIVSLGVGGMLHDIGKTELPANVAPSVGDQSAASLAPIWICITRTRSGYDKIHGEVEPTAAAAVLHHHQHLDGSGFPILAHSDGTFTKMQGNKIHVFHASFTWPTCMIAWRPARGARRSNLEVYFTCARAAPAGPIRSWCRCFNRSPALPARKPADAVRRHRRRGDADRRARSIQAGRPSNDRR
jgi:hypothetical protein